MLRTARMLALVTLAWSLKPQAPGSRFGASLLTKTSAQQARAREVPGGTMKTKVFIYYFLRVLKPLLGRRPILGILQRPPC